MHVGDPAGAPGSPPVPGRCPPRRRQLLTAGRVPQHTVTCGGSDANELNAKGLPTLVISVGYKDIHTNEESMPIDELNCLAEVCAGLMLKK